MPPYSETFDPVALTDQVVRLQPDDDLRRVQAVEQIAEFDVIDMVSELGVSEIAAGSTEDPVEIDSFELNQNNVGQFHLQVLSNIRLQVRQPKAQDRRFNTSGEGPTAITPVTDPNKTVLYVQAAGDPQFAVENPNNYPLTRALVQTTGFRLVLEPGTLSSGEVDQQPISIPVGTLDRYTQDSESRAVTQSAARGGRR